MLTLKKLFFNNAAIYLFFMMRIFYLKNLFLCEILISTDELRKVIPRVRGFSLSGQDPESGSNDFFHEVVIDSVTY